MMKLNDEIKQASTMVNLESEFEDCQVYRDYKYVNRIEFLHPHFPNYF